LCQSFANFFSDNIHKLHTSLLINRISTSPDFPPPFTPPNFSFFTCVITDEVSKLLSQSPDTNCDLDPIPTSLLKQCSHILTFTNISNLSLSTCIFPDQFKNWSVHPHLKISNLSKDDRPLSHLSFLSKLTERVVKLCLADYLSTNYLLNSFQSAYIKHYSSGTTLLSVHDHIITAMRHQQVTCLTLLDISAAFDTVDHSIFLERLSSWFGISSTALSRIKCYLLNRSFYVNIENSKSSVFQLLYGVPQGSVLGSLLFILYTTPLSTVISNSSVNHLLYADDTQLLLSFSVLDFSHNMTHLEKTIAYPTGSLPISCLVILLKLSFSSLLYHNTSLYSIILLFMYLTMSMSCSNLLILLVILVSSLIKICPLHNISLLFLNHASTIFVT